MLNIINIKILIIANIMMIRKIRRIHYILYTNVIFLIMYI